MAPTRRDKRLAVAFAAGALTCLLAGCGGGDTASSEIAAASPDASEGSQVDSEVWSNGVVELRVGDCVNDIPTAEDDPYDAGITSCESPHDREVFSFVAGVNGWDDIAPELAAYVGVSADELEEWLAENGLAVLSSWSQTAGMFHYLSAEEGQLGMPYRNAGNGSTTTSTLEP